MVNIIRTLVGVTLVIVISTFILSGPPRLEYLIIAIVLGVIITIAQTLSTREPKSVKHSHLSDKVNRHPIILLVSGVTIGVIVGANFGSLIGEKNGFFFGGFIGGVLGIMITWWELSKRD